MAYMTPDEIRAYGPETPGDPAPPLERARRRMVATGQWHPAQGLGRRWPIGCVALEVTQRCNLDCSLCYLSENSEAVKDVPLAELCRRVDAIAAAYGPDPDVQVTGGDPTLRARPELVAIVRHIRGKGMRPALFTNGIRAKRDLLAELAAAGLVDVAFHVDTTQSRKGYTSERELNAVRRAYVERARGLPLAVYFNTTVFDGNLNDIPDVVRFFVEHSDVVRLASFQLQADTGRGTEGARGPAITPDAVAARIEAGCGGTRLSFGLPAAGHARCNRYAATLVVNGAVHDLFDDAALVADALDGMGGLQLDRTDRRRALRALAGWAARNPRLWRRGVAWAGRRLRAMRRDLLAARGRANKLSFFIHDFMDARRLERERVDACAFMVATAEGMTPMCLHNAKRDDFILRPLRVGGRFWHPLTGALHGDAPKVGPVAHGRRTLKGRARARAREAG